MATRPPTSRLEAIQQQAARKTTKTVVGQHAKWKQQQAERVAEEFSALVRRETRGLGNMFNWKYHAGEY